MADWNELLQAAEDENADQDPNDPTGQEAIEAFIRAQQAKNGGTALRGLAAMTQPAGDTASDASTPPVPTQPLSNMQRVQNSREQIANLLAHQQGGVENLQRLVDRYQKEPEKLNLAPILALTDFVGGTHNAENYKAPETRQEKQMNLIKLNQLVNKEREAPIKDAERQYASDNSAESKYYKALSGQIGKEDKAVGQMRQDVLFKRGTNPQISQSINTLRRANQVVNLMDSLPEGGPIPSELANIATGLGALVSGSNVVTDSRLKEVLPKNLDLSWASVKQWLTSNPQGADQHEFLKRFRREIDAETKGARQTLHGYLDSVGDSYSGSVSPERHAQLLKAGHDFVDRGYYTPGQIVAKTDRANKIMAASDIPAFAKKNGITPEEARKRLSQAKWKIVGE